MYFYERKNSKTSKSQTVQKKEKLEFDLDTIYNRIRDAKEKKDITFK